MSVNPEILEVTAVLGHGKSLIFLGLVTRHGLEP
jgi:hypothetical protein